MVQKQILALSVGCLDSLTPAVDSQVTAHSASDRLWIITWLFFWITGRVDWTVKMSGNAFFQRSERILTAKHLNGPLEDNTFNMLSKGM